MAKSWKNGAMILDAAGQGFSGRPVVDYTRNEDGSWVTNPAQSVTSTQTRVRSITVDPSAAAWVVVLSNQDGSVAWTQKGAAATGDTFKVCIDFNGVVLTTATNITRVILETESVQW